MGAIQKSTEAYLIGLFEDTKPVCHPCQEGDNTAEGHSVGPQDPWRKIIKTQSRRTTYCSITLSHHHWTSSLMDHLSLPQSLNSVKCFINVTFITFI